MWGTETIENNNKDFEPLEKGKYICIMDNCTIEKSQSTGSPYLQFTFTIEGPKSSGRKIWHKLFFTPNAQKMCEQQLENLMCRSAITTAKDAEQYMVFAAEVVFKLVGKRCEVSVTGHRDYNGKTYANTFIGKYVDTPFDWMKAAAPAGNFTNHAPKAKIDSSEELPF